MNVIVCECWIVNVNEIRERVFVNDFASLLAGNHCARNRNGYSLNLVGAAADDLHRLVRLLISCLELLDELECPHAHDDAAEDNILVVEEGEGSAHRDIELGLVRVAQTVSLAHAQHANLLMLNLERLVFEGSTVYGCAKLRVLRRHDSAHLNVHALDDAVYISANVG